MPGVMPDGEQSRNGREDVDKVCTNSYNEGKVRRIRDNPDGNGGGVSAWKKIAKSLALLRWYAVL